MPFLSPNRVKALNGKISHSVDLLTPSSPGGLPTLSLTINRSWLPWGRVAQSCRTRVLDLDSSRTRVRFLEDLDLDLDSKAKDLDLDLKGEDLELGL